MSDAASRRTARAAIAAWFALSWLIALTVLNDVSGGALRSTILFAVPVFATGWQSWRLGLVFAALGLLSAVAGGAMPEPGSPAPPEIDALVAFAKLALDAACAHVLGTHWRADGAAQGRKR